MQTYNPSQEVQETISDTYNAFLDIQDNVMGGTFSELNDRTPGTFVDESRKRANSYTPTKDSYDPPKEDWQANVFTPTTRNKLRAMVGAVSKELPKIAMTADDPSSTDEVLKAEVLEHLVRRSYTLTDNPELDLMSQSWACAVDGTIVVRDFRLVRTGKVRRVKNFDPVTGKVEVDESDETIEDRLAEEIVPLDKFLEKEPYISDVQLQPRVMHIEYMELGEFNERYGKYKGAEYVKEHGALLSGEADGLFGENWSRRLSRRLKEADRPVEVIHDYSKVEDFYRITANGVQLLDAPMLWGDKDKRYPFSKTYFEPFANTNFFRGNSLPNILMALQDEENTLTNTALDKTYRSMITPMVVGIENYDALELSDEYVDSDTKIYVNDVNQIAFKPTPQVNSGEMAMLKMIKDEESLASVDSLQQGFSGTGSTAREIVIANENAAQMKGLFFTMLKDLWLQKVRIRALMILTTYAQPIKDGKKKVYPVYSVPKSRLSTGETGTIQIRVLDDRDRDVLKQTAGKREDGTEFNRLDAEEELITSASGVKTEIIAVSPTFLDDFKYTIDILPESLELKGRALEMALHDEKLTKYYTFWPQIAQDNSEALFSDTARLYGDDPDKFLQNIQAPMEMPELTPEGQPVEEEMPALTPTV